MDVRLSADQKALIRRAIESGRFQRTEDAMREAMSLWEERERLREEILAAIDVAEESLAGGAGREITPESMQALASEVKRRGRARLRNGRRGG